MLHGRRNEFGKDWLHHDVTTAAIHSESSIQSPTNFFLGNRHHSVQGVRVYDWSPGWRVLSVWRLLRNQEGEWESAGMGLSILMQSKHGICRGEHLGCLVRPGDTRTCCRSDRCTQQSRDFSRGETSKREVEAGLGWGYRGLGTEGTEVVALWVPRWWVWREGGKRKRSRREFMLKHSLQGSSF